MRKLFSKLENTGLGVYKESYLSQLYFDYRLTINKDKLNTFRISDAYDFPPHMIRRIIVHYQQRQVFGAKSLK
jgi:hypothetical protein